VRRKCALSEALSNFWLSSYHVSRRLPVLFHYLTRRKGARKFLTYFSNEIESTIHFHEETSTFLFTSYTTRHLIYRLINFSCVRETPSLLTEVSISFLQPKKGRHIPKCTHVWHSQITVAFIRCYVMYFTKSSYKPKSSLCSTNEEPCREGIWGIECVNPCFNELGRSWKWVVSFRSRPLYSRGKNSRYPLDRRLGGSQSRSKWCGEENILHPTRTRTSTPRSPSPEPVAIPTV
jgi:hypothetical protein